MSITQLSVENVKRLQAVRIRPNGGLVAIGGRNAQGKTSVLDSIAMALGGEKEVPGEPIRKGAERAEIVIQTDDLVITRTFTASGSTLKVTDALGKKLGSPQAVLDAMTGKLTFDPLAFMRLEPKKQAEALRKLTGLDFTALDKSRAEAYAARTAVGRDVETKRAQLATMPKHADAPAEEVDANALRTELATARETNTRARRAETLTSQAEAKRKEAAELRRRADHLEAEAVEFSEQARKCPAPVDEDDILTRLTGIEQTNRKVRENAARAKLVQEGKAKVAEQEALTKRIEEIDAKKAADLAAAKFPVDGLAFTDDGVTFSGVPLAQASAAEQMRVAVAIAAALNPKLRVMLVRDGSLLDDESLALLAKLAEERGLQVWIERVGKGQECAVIIEDGEVAEDRTGNADKPDPVKDQAEKAPTTNAAPAKPAKAAAPAPVEVDF